jgi:hypothetical protein
MIPRAHITAWRSRAPRRLNEQVRRTRARFPEDFAFALTREEFANLKSQVLALLVAGSFPPTPLRNTTLRMSSIVLGPYAPVSGCARVRPAPGISGKLEEADKK